MERAQKTMTVFPERKRCCTDMEGGRGMNRCVKWIVRHRVLMIVLCILSLIPACLSAAGQKVSYDLFSYLPSMTDAQKGQDILIREFGEGAFSLLVTEGLTERQEMELERQLENMEHVRDVLSYAGVTKGILPVSMLPDGVRTLIANENARLCAVFFRNEASSEETMSAIEEIRRIAGKQCFISGLAAGFTDLRRVVRQEEAACMLAAVVSCAMVMMLMMDSILAPLLILLSMGVAVVWNIGTNGFFPEINAMNRVISIVTQMAETLFFPIVLWYAYREERVQMASRDEAVVRAVTETFKVILGSGLAMIAGGASICLICFSSGAELGISMLKGILLGMIGNILFFPCLLRLADGAVEKTAHRPLMPDAKRCSRFVLRRDRHLTVLFAVLLISAACGLPGLKTGTGLTFRPEKEVPSRKAEDRLVERFGIGSVHLMLMDVDLPAKEVRSLAGAVRRTEGIRTVLGMHTLSESGIPDSFLPSRLLRTLKGEQHQLLFAVSAYRADSEVMRGQIAQLTEILKASDPSGFLTGDAALIQELEAEETTMILQTALITFLAVVVILGILQKSLLLPVLAAMTAEGVICSVLSIPSFVGMPVPTVAPVVMFSLQFGMTAGETLLVTEAYRKIRTSGKPRREAVSLAVSQVAHPVIACGAAAVCMLAAVDVASSIEPVVMTCRLAACGACAGVLAVLFILPAFLILFDRVIVRTTAGMKGVPGR